MTANVIARKLEVLSEKGALKAVDIADVLDVRPETVSRWNQGKAFPRSDAEKVLRDLEYVVEQLAHFYAPAEAREWLLSRQKFLDDQMPAALIQQGRTDEVLRVLRALLDGVHV